MGNFSYLEAYTSNGAYGRKSIREVKAEGALLQIKRRKELISIDVITHNQNTDNLQLSAYNNGLIIPINVSGNNVVLSSNSFQEGKVTFILSSKTDNTILSIRTIYVCSVAVMAHSELSNKPMEGNITGTWKCSDQTLRNLGIGYDKMNGKIELKADSTFTMTAKGRGIRGHSFWPHRTVSVKLNGTYSIKGNSISFKLKRDNIKCHINDEVMDNDPKLDPTPAYKLQQEHTTWDAADRRYETAKDHGSMQEESLKDDIHKAMPFRANVTFIDSKTVQIGSTIYLKR